MGSKAKVPKPNPEADYQQYLTEARNALKVQSTLLPEQAVLEERLAPTLINTRMAGLKATSQGLMGLYGDLYEPAQALQKRYATDQMAMLSGMGGQATQAALASLDPTTRGIYSTFGQQALTDLQAGTGLTAQETTQAQQAARAAGAARGMSFSRQGADLEILNTYNMGQRRLAQRQGVAQQAYQMGAGQQQIGLTGFLNPAFAASQQYSLTGLAGGASGMYADVGSSPFLQPESQYLANIRANRIQMETAIQSANAQRSGGIMGGALQAVGTIAAAKMTGGASLAAGGCWVAREVYGEDNPEWMVFRQWLFTEAPEWFRDLYLQEGERFAEFISDKPVLKSIVKMAMDTVVKPRFKLLNV
jgi:hypothetical protein